MFTSTFFVSVNFALNFPHLWEISHLKVLKYMRNCVGLFTYYIQLPVAPQRVRLSLFVAKCLAVNSLVLKKSPNSSVSNIRKF